MNSNAKGKRGELELAAVLRDAGFSARRAQQYSGTEGTEDIKHDLPGVYLECKRVERLHVLSAYQQAERDSKGSGCMPVVAHRSNKAPWLVTLALDDFLSLVRGEGMLD